MKPYYEDALTKIYHGDCRELLPTLGTGVDLVLTDPPYGIDLKFGGVGRTTIVNERVTGDDKPFDPSHLLAWRAIIFGANHFADRLPPSAGWLVWDKVTTNKVVSVLSDAELAWTNCVPKVRAFRHMWNGAFRDSERTLSVHPTQKPVALMRWCLSLVPDARVVMDPYMGSGPVLRAAKDAGLRSIGVEIEERYCEVAAERLSQSTLGLSA